jgi:hypothetical protein
LAYVEVEVEVQQTTKQCLLFKALALALDTGIQ